jgi:hypothetical protein
MPVLELTPTPASSASCNNLLPFGYFICLKEMAQTHKLAVPK